MKKALIALALLCILVLSGCSGIFDGSYTSVTPHSVPSEAPAAQEKYGAKDRDELYAVVEKLVPPKKAALVDLNKKALALGKEYK